MVQRPPNWAVPACKNGGRCTQNLPDTLLITVQMPRHSVNITCRFCPCQRYLAVFLSETRQPSPDARWTSTSQNLVRALKNDLSRQSYGFSSGQPTSLWRLLVAALVERYARSRPSQNPAICRQRAGSSVRRRGRACGGGVERAARGRACGGGVERAAGSSVPLALSPFSPGAKMLASTSWDKPVSPETVSMRYHYSLSQPLPAAPRLCNILAQLLTNQMSQVEGSSTADGVGGNGPETTGSEIGSDTYRGLKGREMFLNA